MLIDGNLAIPIFDITGVESGLQEQANSIIEQLTHRVGILSKNLYLLAIFDASEEHLWCILGGIHTSKKCILLEEGCWCGSPICHHYLVKHFPWFNRCIPPGEGGMHPRCHCRGS